MLSLLAIFEFGDQHRLVRKFSGGNHGFHAQVHGRARQQASTYPVNSMASELQWQTPTEIDRFVSLFTTEKEGLE